MTTTNQIEKILAKKKKMEFIRDFKEACSILIRISRYSSGLSTYITMPVSSGNRMLLGDLLQNIQSQIVEAKEDDFKQQAILDFLNRFNNFVDYLELIKNEQADG